MTRSEAIRCIRENKVLSDHQKEGLIYLLNTHPSTYPAVYRWIRILNRFVPDSFDESLLSERSELLHALLRVLRERRPDHVLWNLLEIFYGKEGTLLDFGRIIPHFFVRQVLERLRKESAPSLRELWVELLVCCCSEPPSDSTVEDFLSGLHHRDELFRCKILRFLYKHFEEKSLSRILSEVQNIKPPPTPLFYGTLCHFLRLHPRVDWTKDLEKLVRLRGEDTSEHHERDGLWILLQEMRDLLTRNQVLAMNPVPLSPFLKEEGWIDGKGSGPEQRREQSVRDDKREFKPCNKMTGIRLERFEKIERGIGRQKE